MLKPGGLAIGVTGPPDSRFAKQLGAPKFMGVAMGLLSRKVRKQARQLGVRYSRALGLRRGHEIGGGSDQFGGQVATDVR